MTARRTNEELAEQMVDFLRDTRASVGVSAVLLALMCFAGTALVADHVVLVYHRNILQSAAASASIAATRQIAELDPDLTQEEAAAALEPLARRYVLANLPEGTRESARDSLEITLTPDREVGVVGVRADADLGGAIVGRYIWGRVVEKASASSGAEAIVGPVDLVLAIDVTASMNLSINKGAGRSFPEEDRRINVVRSAAQVLISTLFDQDGGETGHVAVGVVPFNTTVNIGAERHDWVSDLGQGHKVIPLGFGPWLGCVEHRAANGDLDLSIVTPDETPFTSWFSPSTLQFRPAERAALAAQIVGGEVHGENDWSADNTHDEYNPSPHYGCPRDEIVPLTTDRNTVEQAITTLQPWDGGGTMTHVGVVWGRRLLASEWRDAWGLSGDVDDLDRKKVLVVLTDGVNGAVDSRKTYPGMYTNGKQVLQSEYISDYTGYGRAGSGTTEEGFRVGSRFDGVSDKGQTRVVLNSLLATSCQLAKDEGITVFSVSAVPRGHRSEAELRGRLVACATSEDHAFVENSDPGRMTEAFREIGRMVQGIRRTRTVVSR